MFEFRQALVNPKSDPVPQAQELYKILVGPAAQDIAGAKAVTLMWSLDEVLRYLPMAALHDGHQYLVEKYRNTVFTPASVAELTERPNVKNWQGLGMGVSKSYGQFPALPAVPEELRRVIREANEARPEGVLPGEVMLDEKFTEASMKKALEHKYPLVHIASHFDFQAGNETNSFLLLGGKDAQGTRLTLAEIREDPGFTFADTELLTLSACDTAVGGAARRRTRGGWTWDSGSAERREGGGGEFVGSVRREHRPADAGILPRLDHAPENAQGGSIAAGASSAASGENRRFAGERQSRREEGRRRREDCIRREP